MIRAFSIFLGMYLVVLGIGGLGDLHGIRPGEETIGQSSSLVAWLDLMAALMSFVVAAIITPNMKKWRRAVLPLTLGVGIFAIGMVGFLLQVVSWQVGWNVAVACAFVLVGVAAFWKSERILLS
jgi:hypothetical protein